MDVDSDVTVDSDELEAFIQSQQENENRTSKFTKLKALKSSKPRSINDMSDSDSNDRVLKKKQKKLNVIAKDSDTDRTIDSDELQELIAQSQNEKSGVTKTVSKKAHHSSYKEISDSDTDEIMVKTSNKNISSKKPQTRCKELSDSDSDRKRQKKSNMKIVSRKPQSINKEISDSDSGNEISKKKRINEKLLNKRPQSNYKEISDSDSGNEVPKKKRVNEQALNKRTQSSSNKISNADVVKKKVNETVVNIKQQSTYKEISDSDSDEVVNIKKVNENILNKKSRPKEISDSDDEVVEKKKINKTTSVKKRERCMYGKKCYRRNPDHIKNFYHGDSDELEAKDRKTQSRNTEINPSTNKFPMNKNGKGFNKKKESPRSELDYKGDVIKSESKEKLSSSKQKPSSSKNQESTSSGCKNYNFYLTKVNGIPPKYNCLAYDIKDLLSFKDGTLVSSAQFNYLFDIPWLVHQYPEKYRKCPITVVHGEQRQSKKALEVSCAAFPNIKLCQAKLDIPFGTHHTKMMFLLYKEGFKIVIHTSNIVDSDWDQRTQGMWISPMLPELKNPSTTEGESPTSFKAHLLEYITAYGAPGLEEWLQVIKKHDFSSVRVVLIGSVPGRHLGSKKTSFGHLKLRKMLNLHGSSKDVVSSAWPIICQFSSIGSLGSSPNQWMTSEFGTSLSTLKDMSLPCQSSNIKLVFPTVENVRKSLQGYPAGASLPYSIKVAEKQMYLKSFMHQWKSEKLGRSEASPHIKTYIRVSPDNSNISWFLLTSANLSKAAWGSLEKKDTQFMIRSYELGVLFLPKFFGVETFSTPFSIKNDFSKMFPVPYDIPLEPYTKNDEPWIWDIPHVHAPDRFGMKWCPPLK